MLSEAHLERILLAYIAHYHASQTHLALGKDSPDSRSVEPPSRGKVVEFPEVGELDRNGLPDSGLIQSIGASARLRRINL